MGTQVEESHNSVGMHVTIQGTLPSSASSGPAGPMGMSRTTARGHISCGLGNKPGSDGRCLWNRSLCLLPCPRCAQKQTPSVKATTGRCLFHPYEQTPIIPHASYSVAWKTQLVLVAEPCHLWKQTFNPVPCGLSQACGGSRRGCTHGRGDRHTDSSPCTPRWAPRRDPAPAGTAPCPTGRASGAHCARCRGAAAGTALAPTQRAGEAKWLWTPTDSYLFRLSFYFDITNHFSLFTNHGCDINTNF